MVRIFRILALLIGSLTLATMARGQTPENPFPVDVTVTYVAERSKIASIDCGCFWLQGGSAEGSVAIYHGLGATANFSGEHSGDIIPGVDLNKFSFMAGPRYTYGIGRWTRHLLGEKHRTSLFGEALFGVAHGFDSVFPSPSGTTTSANSFSMQIGGGLNIALTNRIGLRLFELDYVRTNLPNNVTNIQNDLRLAFGVSYYLRKP